MDKNKPMALFLKLKNNHILMSGFYKGVSGLSLFLSIPLLIKYFGKDNYGVWVLVFTLFQWVLLMDFGIQSSLKTKIPILLHNNQIDLIKRYIKSTYQVSIYIAFAILILFAFLIYFVDINSLFNISSLNAVFVKKIFLINIFFFCVTFVVNIHKSLYVSFLKGKYAEESIAINQSGFLILIALAVFFFPDLKIENKLILVSFINGFYCLFVNLFYTFKFFKRENLNLKTSEKTPFDFIKESFKLGSKYMFIQLALMFIFSADNYIISNSFSPKDIVAYDSVNRIFQFPIMIIFAAISPLWSMFATDFIEKNKEKLLSKFKKFNLLYIGILLFILFLALISPIIIPIWIKEDLHVPDHLILFMAITTALRILATFYSFFLYGIGRLNNYIIILLISVLLKIPLTYYLIYLGFEINSIIISTLILMTIWVVFIPYECYMIVKKIKQEE